MNLFRVLNYIVLNFSDQPMQLTVLNVTHDSVQLSWVPGFDGGMTPTYRIRYRLVNFASTNILVYIINNLILQGSFD